MVQVLSSRGRYKEALRLNQRLLAGREKVLGMDHYDTLESLHDIAYNLKQLRNKVEALEWYRRALEEKDRVFGKEHQSTLGTLGRNMASLLDDQGMHTPG
ncbi:hypothetical protein DFP73DRAFT_488304 [Morchella snyderi]|nr:hypothetical protein DFP73DRAFT_488304 [Morchella snyderi]